MRCHTYKNSPDLITAKEGINGRRIKKNKNERDRMNKNRNHMKWRKVWK